MVGLFACVYCTGSEGRIAISLVPVIQPNIASASSSHVWYWVGLPGSGFAFGASDNMHAQALTW